MLGRCSPCGMVVVSLLSLLRAACAEQFTSFTRSTDTISLLGNVTFANQATYEATVLLTSTFYVTGESEIWDSWQRAVQDTHFRIEDGGTLSAYAFPVNFPNEFSAGALVTGVWYDLAYVYDGSQERLYVDGDLLASRPGSGNIGIGPGNIMTVGAIFRDGGIDPSFQGDIKSLRVSNIARYSGNSYTPTFGDFTSDPSTLLLYDFDKVPTGSTIISDLSGHGHTGTAGTGFTGATSPTFGVVLLPGDANLDDKVDFSDLVILAQHYGQPGDWTDGNFNGDPTVDFADLVILAQHYGQSTNASQVGPASTAVPEPFSMPSLLLLAGGLLRWRRPSPRGITGPTNRMVSCILDPGPAANPNGAASTVSRNCST